MPRLGIQGTEHVEGLHGLALGGPGHWEGRDANRKPLPVVTTTQFPQARGLGQTWDPELIEKAAAVEGYETRYAFQKLGRGGLVVRAPNADLSRDPRWGRSEESYGEDPYLVGTLAVAFIDGLQGTRSDDPRYWQTASLMKHFLANSNENGRGGSSSDFDERLFYEYYSVPFRMGVEQGHSDAFMTAYNAWNHVPMTVQPVLRNVVTKDWGFNGIICTDAGALTNMVTLHHYYPDMDHAAAGAIHAGINQFLDRYRDPVRNAYEKKLISDADLNENLKGVFRVMIHLGMLDPKSDVPWTKIGAENDPLAAKGEPWNWPEHKALARRVTDESIVLLKNQGDLLPLQTSKLKSIAVIGPYADEVALDWYSGTPPYAITPLEGIRARAGTSVEVKFDKGQNIDAAVNLAKTADVVIAIVGNHPTCNAGWNVCASPSDGKEAIDRKTLRLDQEELVERLYGVNPKLVVVMQASFPYTIGWIDAHAPAILEITHNSQEQGTGLADVLFGDYNPAGRLTQTWVASEDQLPPMMDYNIRHGRTYEYLNSKPLYAFGYGRSYTTFAYSNLRLSANNINDAHTLRVSVDVKNTGSRAGDEVVQMYVRHEGSKVVRPLEELKGLQRLSIDPGQTRTVELDLPADRLRYWDEARHSWVLEPDKVSVMLGAASNDIKLTRTIEVETGK